MAVQELKVRITDTGLTFWLAFMAFLSSLSAAGIMSDVLTPRGAAVLVAVSGSLQAATAVVTSRIRPIETAQQDAGRNGG